MVAACARCRGKYGCKARMDARQVWMQVKPSRWRGAVKCPTKRLQQVCNKETPTKRLISTECVLFPSRCQCAARFWISWKVHALVYCLQHFQVWNLAPLFPSNMVPFIVHNCRIFAPPCSHLSPVYICRTLCPFFLSFVYEARFVCHTTRIWRTCVVTFLEIGTLYCRKEQ